MMKTINLAYPNDFINRVLVGNCLDVLSGIPDDTIDLTVTSPPYDWIRDYKGYKLDLIEIGKQLFRITKDGGVVVFVMQDATADFAKTGTTFRMIVEYMDMGFRLFEMIIFQKHGTPGAWWNKRFRVDHEYMPVFFKGDKLRHFDKTSLMLPANYYNKVAPRLGTVRKTNGELRKREPFSVGEMKCRGTIWDYTSVQPNREGNSIKTKHPATFSDQIPADFISCFTQENDIVLDPMCGSGTTLVAAENMNRRFIGIDISPEYADLARERLKLESKPMLRLFGG